MMGVADYQIPPEQNIVWNEGDPSLMSVVGSWVSDLLTQQIPGSVVVLIVIVALAPMLVRAAVSFWSRKK